AGSPVATWETRRRRCTQCRASRVRPAGPAGRLRADILPALPGDEQAAAEARVEGEELVDVGAGQAVVGADVRPAAGAGHRQDLSLARRAAVGADPDAAAEGLVEGEEAQKRRVAAAVEHGDVRPAAGAGPDDDVGVA